MTSEGPVKLPMLFFDGSARQFNFFVDHHRVAPLLEGTGMEAVRFFGNKAMVNMSFYQYRHNRLATYNEVFFAVMVVPEAFPMPRQPLANLLRLDPAKWTMGGYVVEMPVTSPKHRAAGREIWGYPKFQTEIPHRFSGKHFEFKVLDPDTGESLLEVSGTEGPGVKLPGYSLVSFTNHDGKILRVTIRVDALFRNAPLKELRIVPGRSDHRFAKNARALGIAETKPFAFMACDAVRQILEPGVPVGEWQTPPMPYAVKGEGWAKPLEE